MEALIRTRFTEFAGVAHPVVLGGMGGGTSPELVAAVSEAGGLGIQAASRRSTDDVAQLAGAVRSLTDRPFGLNLLLFLSREESVTAVLEQKPHFFSTAWPREDQDLKSLFARAHGAGCKVMHMAATLPDAEKAAAAGADVVVAQGTEGGGHVGTIGTAVLVRLVARAVAPVPVLAAGGIADGAGLAAMLALGAEGVLLGTRFLATPEAPIPDAFKRVIVESDGHDTFLTDINDIAQDRHWPGAWSRVTRNRFVERWQGRANELRRHQPEVAARLEEARKTGDVEEAILYAGQTCGLIDQVVPAGQVVEDIVKEAEEILAGRLPGLVT
jgi:NAD(P)H-dependent flavin oxidoreductase YrpB (nitropropane dioxygenase family)